MSCEDVERALLEAKEALTAEEEAHLASCQACRAFQAEAALALSLAALPEPTEAERAALAGVEARVVTELERGGRGRLEGVARLALAAALGGVLAASGVLTLVPPRTEVVVRETRVEVPVAAELPSSVDWPQLEPMNLSDDLVLDEVSWPEPTEGDIP